MIAPTVSLLLYFPPSIIRWPELKAAQNLEVGIGVDREASGEAPEFRLKEGSGVSGQ